MIILFLRGCRLVMLVPIFFLNTAHAEIISYNLVLKHSDIQVVDNYSEYKGSGLIRVRPCSTCNKQELIIDRDSILLFGGEQLGMDVLLYTHLRYPSDQVRIQYNQRDNTVTYIRWMPNDEQEKGLL